MRQSNLLSPALGGWGGPPHHPVAGRGGRSGRLRVTLASSKTLKTRAQAVALFMPAILGSPYYPVAAWERALQLLPAAPDAPAFLVGPWVPLTTRELTSTLWEALPDTGVPHASCYTLHGLHRGAALACAVQGVAFTAIMAQSTWQSGAVHTYVPPRRRPKPWRCVLARLGAPPRAPASKPSGWPLQ